MPFLYLWKEQACDGPLNDEFSIEIIKYKNKQKVLTAIFMCFDLQCSLACSKKLLQTLLEYVTYSFQNFFVTRKISSLPC